jgi:hypothetical protein
MRGLDRYEAIVLEHIAIVPYEVRKANQPVFFNGTPEGAAFDRILARGLVFVVHEDDKAQTVKITPIGTLIRSALKGNSISL